MSDYAHSDALVSTTWAAEHLHDPKVKFIEVDVDTSSYGKGHIPGAIGWNWQTDLNDHVRRDIIDPRAFAELNAAAVFARRTPSFSMGTTTTGLPRGRFGNSNTMDTGTFAC